MGSNPDAFDWAELAPLQQKEIKGLKKEVKQLQQEIERAQSDRNAEIQGLTDNIAQLQQDKQVAHQAAEAAQRAAAQAQAKAQAEAAAAATQLQAAHQATAAAQRAAAQAQAKAQAEAAATAAQLQAAHQATAAAQRAAAQAQAKAQAEAAATAAQLQAAHQATAAAQRAAAQAQAKAQAEAAAAVAQLQAAQQHAQSAAAGQLETIQKLQVELFEAKGAAQKLQGELNATKEAARRAVEQATVAAQEHEAEHELQVAADCRKIEQLAHVVAKLQQPGSLPSVQSDQAGVAGEGKLLTGMESLAVPGPNATLLLPASMGNAEGPLTPSPCTRVGSQRMGRGPLTDLTDPQSPRHTGGQRGSPHATPLQAGPDPAAAGVAPGSGAVGSQRPMPGLFTVPAGNGGGRLPSWTDSDGVAEFMPSGVPLARLPGAKPRAKPPAVAPATQEGRAGAGGLHAAYAASGDAPESGAAQDGPPAGQQRKPDEPANRAGPTSIAAQLVAPDSPQQPHRLATQQEVLGDKETFDRCLDGVLNAYNIKRKSFSYAAHLSPSHHIELSHYQVYVQACKLGGFPEIVRTKKMTAFATKFNLPKGNGTNRIKEWYREQLWHMEQVYMHGRDAPQPKGPDGAGIPRLDIGYDAHQAAISTEGRMQAQGAVAGPAGPGSAPANPQTLAHASGAGITQPGSSNAGSASRNKPNIQTRVAQAGCLGVGQAGLVRSDASPSSAPVPAPCNPGSDKANQAPGMALQHNRPAHQAPGTALHHSPAAAHGAAPLQQNHPIALTGGQTGVQKHPGQAAETQWQAPESGPSKAGGVSVLPHGGRRSDPPPLPAPASDDQGAQVAAEAVVTTAAPAVEPARPRVKRARAEPQLPQEPAEKRRRSARERKEVSYKEDDFLPDLRGLDGRNGDSDGQEDLREEAVRRLVQGVEPDDDTPIKPRKGRGKVNSGLGRRYYGGKVYDSEKGETCHWCRQKTEGEKVRCSLPTCGRGGRGMRMPTMFCEACLRNRHGEEVKEAIDSGDWVCPQCRGGCGKGCSFCCNCSLCRRKNGMDPTGQIKFLFVEDGYTNAHDYLISLTTGEDQDTITKRLKSQPWRANVEARAMADAMDAAEALLEGTSDEEHEEEVEEEEEEEDTCQAGPSTAPAPAVAKAKPGKGKCTPTTAAEPTVAPAKKRGRPAKTAVAAAQPLPAPPAPEAEPDLPAEEQQQQEEEEELPEAETRPLSRA